MTDASAFHLASLPRFTGSPQVVQWDHVTRCRERGARINTRARAGADTALPSRPARVARTSPLLDLPRPIKGIMAP